MFPLLIALLGLIAGRPSTASSQETVEEDRISLPPPPVIIPPPQIDEDRMFEEDLRRRRENNQKLWKRSQKPEPPYSVKMDKALLEEALKNRAMRLLMEASGLLVSPFTSGDRENYTANPTSHFNVLWRLDDNDKGRTSLWAGFRLAPFYGSGLYKSYPASYGFTYFGPAFGIGALTPTPRDSGDGRRASQTDRDIHIPSSGGWLLSAGIAAQSRIAQVDPSIEEEVKGEFDSQGSAFDAPGVWGEARYLHILFGAVGVNGILGVQMGTQKMFLYGGLGFSGWY